MIIPDAVIPSPHFKVPSSPRTIKNLVVHVTINQCNTGVARNVARWFQTPMIGADHKSHPASAHYIVGPDEIIQCVSDGNIAYHAKSPANEISIGVELTAMANWTSQQWAEIRVQEMLNRAAELFANKCSEHNIPAVFVPAHDLRFGRWGITTHKEITEAWHVTDHTDPGPGFPMQQFIDLIDRKLTPP